jgi:hypothetical protein
MIGFIGIIEKEWIIDLPLTSFKDSMKLQKIKHIIIIAFYL